MHTAWPVLTWASAAWTNARCSHQNATSSARSAWSTCFQTGTMEIEAAAPAALSGSAMATTVSAGCTARLLRERRDQRHVLGEFKPAIAVCVEARQRRRGRPGLAHQRKLRHFGGVERAAAVAVVARELRLQSPPHRRLGHARPAGSEFRARQNAVRI